MAKRVMSVWLLAVGLAVGCPTPSWAAQKALGQACTTHQECQSLRCDNRPAAGCVPQDGTGNSGGFCTTHQQCRTGLCVLASGKYTGVCSGGNRALGQACMTHQECQSSRCDNRPGAGCVPQDGTGNSGGFCTTHQQCRTGVCVVASGKYTGVCSTGNRALGQACITHQECQSSRCDNRPGAGCVPQDGTGPIGKFCTTNEQCQKSAMISYCKLVSGIRGVCDEKYASGSGTGPVYGSSSGSRQAPGTSPDSGGQAKCPSGQVSCGSKCIRSGDVCCYQGSANAYSCSSSTHCCNNRCCCSNTGPGMACF